MKYTITKKDAFITKTLQIIAWPVAYIFFKVLLSYRIKNTQHIKKALSYKKPVIFAANHVGELDPIIVTCGVAPRTLWKPMFYTSLPMKEFASTNFGWRNFFYKPAFFRAWGAYALVRGTKDYAQSLYAHEKILQSGNNLCIFPEGGRNEKGKARGGVAYLAEQTDAIVVPVHIEGIQHMSTKEFFTRKRTLTVSYKKPLLPAEYIDATLPVPERYKTAAQFIVQQIYNSQ